MKRQEQVASIRFCTDDNRLNFHTHTPPQKKKKEEKRVKLVSSPASSCGLDDQAAEHSLLQCSFLQNESQTVSLPTVIPLRTTPIRQQQRAGEDNNTSSQPELTCVARQRQAEGLYARRRTRTFCFRDGDDEQA